MKRYVVFHDWGSEGWKVVAECDSLVQASMERERDITNGGGRVLVFEQIPLDVLYGYFREYFNESQTP